MDGQLSFASLDFAGKKKRTKRDVFLARAGRRCADLPDAGAGNGRAERITPKARPSAHSSCCLSRRRLRSRNAHPRKRESKPASPHEHWRTTPTANVVGPSSRRRTGRRRCGG